MTHKSEIFLSDGQSYQLSTAAKEVVKKLSSSDGKMKEELQAFDTARGKVIYVNPKHVVSIINYHSPEDTSNDTSTENDASMDDAERKEHNLKEAQKYQEEIDNME